MKCPNCEQETKYTWGVYLAHPFGCFVCDNCGAKYKYIRPWYYWPIAVLYVVVVILGPGILFYVFKILPISTYTFLAGYWSWIVLMSVLWCTLDKYFESKLPTKLR
jgi:hypothetical protein